MVSNSGTTTQEKLGTNWKNMKWKAFIKSLDMSNSLLFPISFYPTIGVYWSSYTEQELTAMLWSELHTSQADTQPPLLLALLQNHLIFSTHSANITSCCRTVIWGMNVGPSAITAYSQMLSEKSADFCRYVPEDRLNLDAGLTTWKLYILICICSQACVEISIY